jgi:hypothetical protein
VGGQLHDYEDVGGCVEHFVELDDVRMAEELQDAYLSFNLGEETATLEIMFLFFIFALLIIFTATCAPVSSWRPSG